MPVFSLIMQDPIIRDLVQDRTLERSFKDALQTSNILRRLPTPHLFEGRLGDSRSFTRDGLFEPDGEPIKPGDDTGVVTSNAEQWMITPQQYGKTAIIHMPTSALALSDLMVRRQYQLGQHAGTTVGRKVRERLYNAGVSGQTVNSAAVNPASVNVPVKHLNGFTTARASTAVQFTAVGGGNPLAVQVWDTVAGAYVSRNVVGFTPDVAGDEVGPGTLVLDNTVTIATTNKIIRALDRTVVVRPGTEAGVHEIVAGSIFDLATVRKALARLRRQYVPPSAGKYYLGFLDTVSEMQLFADTEFQNLWQGHGTDPGSPWADASIGICMGVNWIRCEDLPSSTTVGSTWRKDPIALETTNAGGVLIHRPVIVGQECIGEHFLDQSSQVSEAGLLGKAGEFNLSVDGIDIITDRIRMIVGKPKDNLEQIVPVTWSYQADWEVGTDSICQTADLARYKRMVVVEHASE